jgi:DNA-binding MarR family transcriptional regulator
MPPSPSPRRPSAPRAAAPVEQALRNDAGHCICGNLRMAARLVSAHYDAVLRPCGIEANQMAMLWVIHAGGRMSSRDVAHGVGIDQSTASRNLAVLEARALVRSTPSKEDRRERVVQLTAQGRRTLVRAYPLWQRAQAEVAAMTADLADLPTVGRTLRRVTRRLQASGRRNDGIA